MSINRPKGWTQVCLGDLVHRENRRVTADYFDRDAWLVRLGDIEAGGMGTATPVPLPTDTSGTPFRAGQVLFGRQHARANRVWLADRPGLCPPETIFVLAPKGRIEPRLLAHLLSAPQIVEAIANRVDGMAYPRLTWQDFADIEVAVPPAAIHGLVGDVLDLARRLATRRMQQNAQHRRLENSMFSSIFGRATPGVRAFQRVKMRDLLAQIQPGWSTQCLNRTAGPGEYGILKTSAVSTGDFIAHENKALPPTLSPRPELSLERGDLLFCRSNSPKLVGSVAIVDADYSHLMFSDKLWRLTPAPTVTEAFIKGLLEMPAMREQLVSRARGTVTSMVNISQQDFMALEAFLPPVELQEAFGNFQQATLRSRQKQYQQAEALRRLLLVLRAWAFGVTERSSSTGANELSGTATLTPRIDRPVFNRLSPIQQKVWTAVATLEAPFSLEILQRILDVNIGEEHLLGLMELLVVLGAAAESGDSEQEIWVNLTGRDREAIV